MLSFHHVNNIMKDVYPDFEKGSPIKLIKLSDRIQHCTIYTWQYAQVLSCGNCVGMSILTLLLWACLFVYVISNITITSMSCVP